MKKRTKKIDSQGPVRSEKMELLEAALQYAARGWPVFPVTAGKRKPPRVVDWPNKATTDPKTVKSMWKKFPGSNIGIATGSRSGLVVIDVDTKKGKNGLVTLEKLTAEHGPLPPTLTANTPSGGKHFYFTTTGKLKTGAGSLGEGVDVRAEGGYIVAAPSVITACDDEVGGAYVWVE